MFKIILWDVDGTLLNFHAAENCTIKKCFDIFNLGICTDEMVSRYSKINQKYWEMLERGEITKPEVLIGRFNEFFSSEGISTTCAKEFNIEYQIRLGDTIVFCDDSKEIINSLRGKIKQYVVSNGTIIAQTRKLKNSGLDQLMDGVFLSEQLGYEKPSLQFFNRVFDVILSTKDISKDEILIVGDSLTSDIKGGNLAGIKTCWYNPNKLRNKNHEHVDYEISNLHDIYEIL